MFRVTACSAVLTLTLLSTPSATAGEDVAAPPEELPAVDAPAAPADRPHILPRPAPDRFFDLVLGAPPEAPADAPEAKRA